MKAIFLLLLFTASAFAAEPEPTPGPQEKADLMLLLPQNYPFSFDTLYGSPEAAATLKAPEHIEIYRIDPFVSPEVKPGTKTILGHIVLGGLVMPSPAISTTLVDLFAAKDTFRDRPMCGGEPVVLIRATSRGVTLDLMFCFKCHDVVIVRNDKHAATFAETHIQDPVAIQVGMPDKSLRSFLQLFQSLFPDDKDLQGVKLE